MRAFFVEDAFSNPEHVTFALKGCLAATICYVFYSILAWPGMAVCTVTCVLAAPAGPMDRLSGNWGRDLRGCSREESSWDSVLRCSCCRSSTQ